MNIFLLAWNLPEGHQTKTVSAMREMTSIYPQLDPGTLWSNQSADGKVFLTTMNMPNDVVQPRQYLNSRDHVTVTYSGLPINLADTFNAHRADHLNSHWKRLPADLEGQFVIIRCDFKNCSIELMTDPFGIEPVFYFHQNDTWVVSNSIWLMQQSVMSRPKLDPLGVGLLLSLGRPYSEKTIFSDVQMIKAGSVWKWESARAEPLMSEHYPLNAFVQSGRRRKKIDAKRLRQQMLRPMELLARDFGTLEIQLTGGIDSRLVAALAIRGQLPARYSTFGHVNAVDNSIAKEITDRFKLEHQILSVEQEDVFAFWDRAWWYLLRQNDGFVGFEEIPFPDTKKLMQPTDKFGVRIWGSGGGIAKGVKAYLFDNFNPNSEEVYNVFKKYYLRSLDLGILRRECIEIAENYFKQFINNCLENGIQAIDIPDIFFLYYHLGRWPGLTARVATPIANVYSPFSTKAFVRTVFSVPLEIRAKRLIHYKLIQACHGGLHKIQYDNPGKFGHFRLNRWRHRIRKYFGSRSLKKKKYETSGPHPLDYIEAKCDHLRDLCLACNNDILWQLVDRRTFESITNKQTSLQERARYLPFFNILSMVYGYDSLIGRESELAMIA